MTEEYFDTSDQDVQWVDINGFYGEFRSPGTSTPISYIQTFATLELSGSVNSKLADMLVPVREIMEVEKLEFDELLQRDLDDHRVANEIIPYLIENQDAIRFFPPILVAVAPYFDQKLSEKLPSEVEVPPVPAGGGQYVKTIRQWGEALRLTRAQHSVSKKFEPKATLSINDDQTKLIILDGQHRAMAFLAIRRTLKGNWDKAGRGAEYEKFYLDVADQLRDKALLNSISGIQLPICICFIPGLSEGAEKTTSAGIVAACRKLFLDVNKQAKKPTRARTILLDDVNLLHVLTRRLLSDVRARASKRASQNDFSIVLDIDSFEYDTPYDTGNTGRPGRKLALSNVEMATQLIRWAAFADDEFYTNLSKRASQGKPVYNGHRFLTECEFGKRVKSAEVHEWKAQGFDEKFKSLEAPPQISHKTLANIFSATWGAAIIKVLEELHPFHAHSRAVVELRAKHSSESGPGNLAYKALFDGQGIYWTIEKYTEHIRQRRSEPENKGKQIPVTQIEIVYDTINRWLDGEFVRQRAANFFQVKDSSKIIDAELQIATNAYGIIITQAFQVGTVMAFAYLKNKLDIKSSDEFLKSLDKWIPAYNKAFVKHPDALDRKSTGVMGCYGDILKPTEWVWFRYVTFEFMRATGDESIPGFQEITLAAESSRREYLERLVKKTIEINKKVGKTISQDDAKVQAKETLRAALKASFGLTHKDFDAWYQTHKELSQEQIEAEDEPTLSDILEPVEL